MKNPSFMPHTLWAASLVAVLNLSLLDTVAAQKEKDTARSDKGSIFLDFKKEWKSLEQAMKMMSADQLKSHVVFLASDDMQGRATPSKELDLAAAYLAKQHEKNGISTLPALKASYFQTANWNEITGKHNPDLPPTMVNNVIAYIEGSDPILKNEYVLVTAHYDHLGVGGHADDKIHNGANDNASGTATVLEVARALNQVKGKLKRSVVFIHFFGEEKGLRGSRYYTQNPVVPLHQTVAALNIEQVGRTDDSEKPNPAGLNITGYHFTSMYKALEAAGKASGIRVWKHDKNSDAFFQYSDNLAFAMAGVPSHTVSAAYMFPDYHQPSDEARKLDYDNMKKINQTIFLAVCDWSMADSVPAWNEQDSQVQPYRAARQKSLLAAQP